MTEQKVDPMIELVARLIDPWTFEQYEEAVATRNGILERNWFGICEKARRSAASIVSMPGAQIGTAAFDVMRERQRQIDGEGRVPEDDDKYISGQLARAAAAYALSASNGFLAYRQFEDIWPWNRAWWKPKNRRYDLVRAGALILAEIERLDRAESRRNADVQK